MSHKTSLIEKIIRPDIQAMNAYHIAPSDKMVKLDAMESPVAWPGELVDDWLALLSTAELNRYPDAEANDLKQNIKKSFGIDPSLDILLGNGSDEIIQLLIQVVANDGASIMAPEPGFVMYKVLAETNRVDYVGVPLLENFQLDVSAMLSVIKEKQPEILFLAQPNNPTGNVWLEQDLRQLVEASSGLVVFDEAYGPFTETDFLPWLAEYDNVLVMRTLSKVGLAGLRLGFLVGDSAWVQQINKIRLPYNINTLTQLSVEFSLQHKSILLERAATICAQRELLSESLSTIEQVDVYPSQANFLLIKFSGVDANLIFEKLKKQGVLVKNLSNGHPLLANCLRITVSEEGENKLFVSALKSSLSL